MKAHPILALCVALIGFQATPGAVGALAPAATAVDPMAVNDRVIVFFDDGATATSVLNSVTDETTLNLERSISSDIRVYRTSDELTTTELGRLSSDLRSLDNVSEVRRDARVTTDVMSLTDPFYASYQHSLYGTYGANTEPAWGTTLGENVNVAVIDTGVVKTHPDLAANIVGGYDFVAADSPGDFTTANDGDGWDSDASDPGDRCDLTSSKSYSSWHGTHVSGTIAAPQNNGVGITGVAPGSKIVPVRALGRCGGYLSDLLPAMRWAAGLAVSGVPANPNPAKVINLSLTSPVDCTGGIKDLVDQITAAGVVIVAAAGNSNTNVLGDKTVTPVKSPSYPANCANALSVAAVDDYGIRASFSNYGSLVDIAAPGVGIASTYNSGQTGPENSNYALLSGTSMAAPHVSGVAALVMSANPTATVAEVTTALKNHVTTFPAYPDPAPQPGDSAYPPCDVADSCGTGIVNAGAAVEYASANSRPSAPTSVSASRSGTSVTVSWTASADPGSTDITKYIVQANGTDSCTTSDGTTTSCTISNMALGTYTFTVQAENSIGRSALSAASSSVTVVSAPSSARNVSAVRTAQSVTVSWDAPTTSGGLTVEYVVSGGPSGNVTTSSTSATFNSLTVGSTYTFAVTAQNTEGSAAAVSASAVTIYSVPSSARNVSAVRAAQSVTVSWDAPTTSGGLTVEYVVSGGPSGNVTTSSTSATFNSLTVGSTYTFAVTAQNTEGSAAAVSASAVTIYSAPSSARNVSAVRTAQSVTVSWDAPTTSGGLTVEYVVSGGPSGNVTTSSTSATFNSLTVGSTYTFAVTAQNTEGSAAAVSAGAVKIYSAPSVARSVSVTPGYLSATVTWSAPSQAGGLPVEYVVSGGPDGDVVTSSTSYTFTVLESGTEYTFSVTARNSEGSASAVTTPVTVVTSTTTSSTTSSTTTTSTTTTTIAPVTTSTLVTVAPPVVFVREIKRLSKTPFSKIYVAPKGSRTKWSVRGMCSIRSGKVVAGRFRGTCRATIAVTLRGKTTRKIISLKVM